MTMAEVAATDVDAIETFCGRWERAWNTHDADAVAAMCADDLVYDEPALGRTAHGPDSIREFADDDAAHARMLSQIAFGEVSSGARAAGRRHARQAIALQPTNLRAWLALAVGARLLTTGAVVGFARRFGKGI